MNFNMMQNNFPVNLRNFGNQNPFQFQQSQQQRQQQLQQQQQEQQQQDNNTNNNFSDQIQNQGTEKKVQPCQEKFSIMQLLNKRTQETFQEVINNNIRQYIDTVKQQNPNSIQKISNTPAPVNTQIEDNKNVKQYSDRYNIMTRNYNEFIAEQAKQKEFTKIRQQKKLGCNIQMKNEQNEIKEKNKEDAKTCCLQEQQLEKLNKKQQIIVRDNCAGNNWVIDISVINKNIYGEEKLMLAQKIKCLKVDEKQQQQDQKEHYQKYQQKIEPCHQNSLNNQNYGQNVQNQLESEIEIETQKSENSTKRTYKEEDESSNQIENMILKKIESFSVIQDEEAISQQQQQFVQDQQQQKYKQVKKLEDQQQQYNLVSNQKIQLQFNGESSHLLSGKNQGQNTMSQSKNDIINKNQVESSEKYQYRCSICPYQTKNQQNLKRHMNTIHKGAVFNCNYCKFMTKTKQNLKRHIMNIHERMDLKCNHENCNYVAANNNYLYKHIKNMHKKLVCDICEEFEAYSKIKISEHKFLKHKDYLMYCDLCNYKSPYANNLIVHIKNMHDPAKSDLFQMIQKNKQVKFSIDNPNYVHKNRKQN